MSCQPCGCDPEANWVCRQHVLLVDDKENRVIEAPAMPQTPVMQNFESGATRNADTHKFDYEGFLNPEALHAFGEYMHSHRRQKDGSVRSADNWQKGIPFRTYVKSLVRHTLDLWRMERGYSVVNPDTGQPHTKQELCCAIVFNAMGYLKEVVDPSPINAIQTKSPR
jgi:hypothetical protein